MLLKVVLKLIDVINLIFNFIKEVVSVSFIASCHVCTLYTSVAVLLSDQVTGLSTKHSYAEDIKKNTLLSWYTSG